MRIGYQILQPLECQLLSRLTRQHHEHDPLELLRVELVGIQRQHALDHDLALLRRENAEALERKQKSAALRRETRELAVGKNPYRRSLAFVLRGQRQGGTIALTGQIRKPVERPLDIRLGEAGTLEISHEMLAFRYLGYLVEHVAVENVNQNVENAAGHHSGMRS